MADKRSNRQRLREERGPREPETGPPLHVSAGQGAPPPMTLKEQVAMYVRQAMAVSEQLPDASVQESFDLDDEEDPGDDLGLSVYQLDDALVIHNGGEPSFPVEAASEPGEAGSETSGEAAQERSDEGPQAVAEDQPRRRSTDQPGGE